MANTKLCYLLSLLFTFSLAAFVIQGSRNQELTYHQSIRTPSSQEDSRALGGNEEQMSSKRLMIGSTAPTCTYNECRGCKYKCRAEQVPVEGNDPINSAYHYKCICHR
ncbi:EPIDERMAL PATTERNING FACTOR-LIKE PROTEIN 9 [Salix viminalis]|uniref:EPIDERMAL PATTERNING FACTOR-LIKE PROTEIN 9 n=1 Tax=Salix viminalis TaxID=40686 RepID=A0A9Q0ZC26_SALVM|nr:EPIDERMAL PATTERNING FACTOR-LIKE PROTEIN 9 [Salix viminalis]